MYRGFDKATLEREYSPSSCIDDIMVYINQYIDVSKTNLDAAKRQARVIENIAYGAHQDETLDLFLPQLDSTEKRKLQVYIHGGYWQELTKNESAFAAANFQHQGCHFAVINYSLAPNASLTEIVEQNRRALVYLYEQAEAYGYDRDEIYISGSSAGGHLALMMLLTDWQEFEHQVKLPKNLVRGVCAVSGVFDLEPIQHTYINDPLKLTTMEMIQNSPINYPVKNVCPVILAYGDNETSEFKRQTHEMQVWLQSQGIPVEFSEIAERNHFDVIMDLGHTDSWLFKQTAKQMGF